MVYKQFQDCSFVQILGGRDDYLPALLELVAADHLPKHFGGTLDDPSMTFPTEVRLVPTAAYWEPKEGEPTIDELKWVVMKVISQFHILLIFRNELYAAAGYIGVLTVKVNKGNAKKVLLNVFW